MKKVYVPFSLARNFQARLNISSELPHSKKQGIPCFLEKKKSKEFQKSKERKIGGGVRDMSAAAMSLTPPGRPGGVCVCEREAFLS